MLHLILHTLIDTAKIVPFLYVAFLIIEYIEHKILNKNIKLLGNSKKYGPLTGGILGMIPQCGFSVIATNLYSSKIITVGTLIAVYLSTSDEMLPILLTNGMSLSKAITILLMKAGIAIIFGFVIDIFLKNKFGNQSYIKDICKEEECHCNKNIFFASLKHTLSITIYIFIASLIIGGLMHFLDTETISKILFQGSGLSYFIISLIGLIPNCASSVLISELYTSGIISFGNMIGGLLTASGVGILILFKTNDNIKQNIIITLLIYLIGILSGIFVDILGICIWLKIFLKIIKLKLLVREF